jgi:hypothetical protein
MELYQPTKKERMAFDQAALLFDEQQIMTVGHLTNAIICLTK